MALGWPQPMVSPAHPAVMLIERIEIFDTALHDVKVVVPARTGDNRGFFSEVWNRRSFALLGIDVDFVQDNYVRNPRKGTLRGLHYQIAPAAQGKLVRVARGAIFDVAVDLRRGSPEFARYAGVVLGADNRRELWVPPGFAHGYCTLEDDTEVHYKVTDFYSPEHERGIVWDDPRLAIAWPMAEMAMAERDRGFPRLSAQTDLFDFAS